MQTSNSSYLTPALLSLWNKLTEANKAAYKYSGTSPLGHLYSGERDTFSWSRNPGLTSIQGTPYHSKSDCPQKSLISFCVRWSQWRQLSLTISLKIGALHFGEFNTQHRGDKLIMNFLYIIKLLEIMTGRFRGRVRETFFICWLIINKPQPNLYSWDTFIQGCLSRSQGCPLNRCSTVLSRPYHHEKQERRVWKGKLGKLSTCVYQIHTFNRCAKLTNQTICDF